MEFIGDVARKTGDAVLLRVEAEKSRRVAEIAAESGLFRVPRVLQFDAERGVLEFERIPDLIQFSDMVVCGMPEAEEIADNAGQALAVVHRELRLSDTMRTPLPEPWCDEAEGEVFIHGDYTVNNVCYDQRNRTLVVVDWSAAPSFGRAPTVGPRSFDVAWFVRHLHMGAPWTRTLSWPASKLCNAFIQAYADAYGSPLNYATWERLRPQLDLFSRETIRERLRNRGFFVRPGKFVAQRILDRAWRSYEPPAKAMTRPGTLSEILE